MPETRYFVVTQTREVTVQANELIDAAQIADAYFKDGPKPEVPGARVTSKIRFTDLIIRESR